jgi:hypothetical protein
MYLLQISVKRLMLSFFKGISPASEEEEEEEEEEEDDDDGAGQESA